MGDHQVRLLELAFLEEDSSGEQKKKVEDCYAKNLLALQKERNEKIDKINTVHEKLIERHAKEKGRILDQLSLSC